MQSNRFLRLFLLLFAAGAGIYFLSCKKDVEPTASEKSPVLYRDEEEPTYSYYIDEELTDAETFAAADSNYYRHFVLDSVEGERHVDCHVFTTRQKYETWGDAMGFRISEINQIEDRLYFVADSAGIIPMQEDTTYVVPGWYDDYQEELTSKLAGTSTSILCLIGGRLSKHMCNPDLPPGVPWNCSGQNGNFTIWYPAPIGVPALTIMNNKASAWLPNKTFLCSGRNFGHFRGYNKWFFSKKIMTISVNLNLFLTPPAGPGLFVPFNGIYAPLNDKVSSFSQWGTEEN